MGGREEERQARARTYGKALIIEADTDADGNTAAWSAYQIFRDYEVRTCCRDVVCTFPCVNAYLRRVENCPDVHRIVHNRQDVTTNDGHEEIEKE